MSPEPTPDSFKATYTRQLQGCEELLPRFRAKRENLIRVEGLFPESHGQNLAVTVLRVPCSLDSERPTPGTALPRSAGEFPEEDAIRVDVHAVVVLRRLPQHVRHHLPSQGHTGCQAHALPDGGITTENPKP